MKHLTRIMILPLLLFFVSGCSGRFWVAASTSFERDFKPHLDKWTYDDLVKYQSDDNYTKKAAVATSYSLSRDLIFLTYTWGNFDGKTIQKTVYYAGGFLYPPTSETESLLIRDGIRQSFVFDKKKKLLKWCQYLYYDQGHLRDESECGDVSFKPGAEEKFTSDPGAAGGKSTTATLEEKLKDLQELKDKKVITDSEYKKMREKALNEFK